MKISDMLGKPHDPREPRQERDGRTGEIIPACIGRKHWWYYVGHNWLKCKHCGAVKLVDR